MLKRRIIVKKAYFISEKSKNFRLLQSIRFKFIIGGNIVQTNTLEVKYMKQILQNRLNAILIIGIIILYVAFLSFDMFFIPRSIESRYLKYASITLCFLLVTSLTFKSVDKYDSKYVVIAFIFTMIADIFLLFTDNKITGIFFFCLVQLTYLKRYNKRFFKTTLYFVGIAILVNLLLPFQPLYVITGLYASLIGACFFSTFYTKLPKFNFFCVRIGMTLFILCDIHVALYNQLSTTSDYYRFVTLAMWLFYLPSQLILAMSASHPMVDNR